MPESATIETPPAETTATATPATEPKGLSVPMGEIIGDMMSNLPAEKRTQLNKGSSKESAAAPVETAAVETTTPAATETTAAEPVKEKGTLAEFLPPEAQSEQPLKSSDTPPAVQQLSEDDKKLPEDIKGKKGQDRWHKITSAADAANAEVTRLRTENEQLKTAPKVDEDTRAYVTQLEGRLQQMANAFERVSLLENPAIQDQFVLPREQEMQAAVNLLKEIEIDPAGFQKAMMTKGKARIEALDELTESITSPTVRGRIFEHVAKIENFDEQLAKVMTDVKGNHERLAAQDRVKRHQAAKQEKEHLNTLYDSTIDYLRNQGFEYLNKNGNPKFDELVDTIVEEGRTMFTSTESPQQLAAASVGLPLAIRYRNACITLTKQLQAANTEISDLKGSTPGLNDGSSAATATPAAATITPERGAVEIAMENIRGGGS